MCLLLSDAVCRAVCFTSLRFLFAGEARIADSDAKPERQAEEPARTAGAKRKTSETATPGESLELAEEIPRPSGVEAQRRYPVACFPANRIRAQPGSAARRARVHKAGAKRMPPAERNEGVREGARPSRGAKPPDIRQSRRARMSPKRHGSRPRHYRGREPCGLSTQPVRANHPNP